MSLCTSDDDCVFLFHCAQHGKCQHDPVFPLKWYTVLIYLLIPLACGLVNSTGNSMGVFKVLILMNMLRYESTEATMIAQALVVGSALPNYFSILFRKHPILPTSLINFNVVYILVPCCLLGSTLGSLAGQFIPVIGQDVLIMMVFSYFTVNFYRKYQSIKNKQAQSKMQKLINRNDSYSICHQKIEEIRLQNLSNPSKESYQYQYVLKSNSDQQKYFDQSMSSRRQKSVKASIDLEFCYQRSKILQYERSFHFKDISFSILVFIVFQFLVFLVQGKLPFLSFSQCSWKYGAGLSALTVITLGYLKLIHTYMSNKFEIYDKLQIEQQIQLNKIRNFGLISLGGFLAGIVQGILGVGSGSAIMAALLMTPINTLAATATSGYQILFTGSAALVQGFINGQINIIDTAFFIGICVILGGLVTIGITYYIRDKNPLKVSKILILIIFMLCLMSVIMVIPSGLSTYFSFGWDNMTKTKFKC